MPSQQTTHIFEPRSDFGEAHSSLRPFFIVIVAANPTFNTTSPLSKEPANHKLCAIWREALNVLSNVEKARAYYR
jgi:hypothetical protein